MEQTANVRIGRIKMKPPTVTTYFDQYINPVVRENGYFNWNAVFELERPEGYPRSRQVIYRRIA